MPDSSIFLCFLRLAKISALCICCVSSGEYCFKISPCCVSSGQVWTVEILISRKYDKLFVFLVYFLILPVTIAKDKTVDIFCLWCSALERDFEWQWYKSSKESNRISSDSWQMIRIADFRGKIGERPDFLRSHLTVCESQIATYHLSI